MTLQQFLTDRGASQDSFAFRKGRYRLREVAAYLSGNRDTQLIGKTRCHIGFMDDTGNVQSRSCPYDRYADETAFGKDNVGTDPL